jgi:hypothetical protein
VNDITRIPIEKDHLRRAAELARQCSAAAVRERVLVAQSAAWAVRDSLSREFNFVTEDGRSAQSKFVELLDVCDFSVGGWRVETRAALTSEQSVLYVPTIPLMVGLLSDFYLNVEVDRNLTGVRSSASRGVPAWPPPTSAPMDCSPYCRRKNFSLLLACRSYCRKSVLPMRTRYGFLMSGRTGPRALSKA